MRDRFPALMALEARLNCSWLNIHAAISKTESKLSHLRTALFAEDQQSLSPRASFVCFGSLARAEWTDHSDLDWVMLVLGDLEEQHAFALRRLTSRLNETKQIGPAPAGMFGSTVSVAKLTASITRPFSVKDLSLRLLPLLESISVGDDNPRTKAVHKILTAYFAHWNSSSDQAGSMSGLLLNDIAKLGRTMSVDLEREPQEQDGQKWGLRNTKRRFSRKLIIATGSLACLQWKLQCAELTPQDRLAAHDAIEYFEQYLARPPLEILAAEVTRAKLPKFAASRMFDAYDQFLGIVDHAESREHLARLTRHLADTSALFKQVQTIGEEFGCNLRHLLNLTRVSRCELRPEVKLNARDTKQGARPIIGSNALTVFMSIVSLDPGIGEVFFCAPRRNPSLRDRLGDASPEWNFVKQATNRYRDVALPVWAKCLLSDSDIPEEILQAISFHQGITETRFAVKVEELTYGLVRQLAESSAPNSLFSVCSQVQMKDGSIRHIPMLDFLCAKSPKSLENVRKIAARLGSASGFILESDRSYHFYGSELLSERDLVKFLATALLFAPLIDQSWIAHQLMDRCCALRIGPRQTGGAEPRLVCYVD